MSDENETSDERKPFDVIFLQWDDLYPFEEYSTEGVTWSQDKVNDSDIEYVMNTPERKAAGELLEACEATMEWLKSTGYHKDYSGEYCLYADYDPGDLFDQVTAAIAKARVVNDD